MAVNGLPRPTPTTVLMSLPAAPNGGGWVANTAQKPSAGICLSFSHKLSLSSGFPALPSVGYGPGAVPSGGHGPAGPFKAASRGRKQVMRKSRLLAVLASTAMLSVGVAAVPGGSAGAASVRYGGVLHAVMPWVTIPDNFNPLNPGTNSATAGGTAGAIYEIGRAPSRA